MRFREQAAGGEELVEGESGSRRDSMGARSHRVSIILAGA
jgi:hypothetical protein